MSRVTSIDLNADLGEECGNDSLLFPIITSANVAAGGHAGGGTVLEETIHQAQENNVFIGAHPAYEDRENFGRFSQAEKYSFYDLQNLLYEQISLVIETAHKYNTHLTHVKPHGALYHDANNTPWVAEAIILSTIEASENYETPLYLTGFPGSLIESYAKEYNQRFVPEGFADRTYQDTGLLTSRNENNAVIEDPQQSTQQVLDMVLYKNIKSITGTRIPLKVETICLHGDTHNAVDLARNIRNVLLQQGITVRPPLSEKL